MFVAQNAFRTRYVSKQPRGVLLILYTRTRHLHLDSFGGVLWGASWKTTHRTRIPLQTHKNTVEVSSLRKRNADLMCRQYSMLCRIERGRGDKLTTRPRGPEFYEEEEKLTDACTECEGGSTMELCVLCSSERMPRMDLCACDIDDMSSYMCCFVVGHPEQQRGQQIFHNRETAAPNAHTHKYRCHFRIAHTRRNQRAERRGNKDIDKWLDNVPYCHSCFWPPEQRIEVTNELKRHCHFKKVVKLV